MTNKQRAAIEALRDVMREHEIDILPEAHGWYLAVRDHRVKGSWTNQWTSYRYITKLLEQEQDSE